MASPFSDLTQRNWGEGTPFFPDTSSRLPSAASEPSTSSRQHDPITSATTSTVAAGLCKLQAMYRDFVNLYRKSPQDLCRSPNWHHATAPVISDSDFSAEIRVGAAALAGPGLGQPVSGKSPLRGDRSARRAGSGAKAVRPLHPTHRQASPKCLGDAARKESYAKHGVVDTAPAAGLRKGLAITLLPPRRASR